MALLELRVLDVEDQRADAGDADLAAVGVAGEGPLDAVVVELERGVGVVGQGDDRLIVVDPFEGDGGGEQAAPEILEPDAGGC